MIEIKLTFATLEDAADAMLKLAGQDYSPAETASTAPATEPEQPAPKPRATRKPKAEAKPDDTPKGNISSSPEDRKDPGNPDEGEADQSDETPTEEPAAEEAKAEWSKEDIEKAIQERVRPALSNYMKAFGQTEARAFLAKFQNRTPETAKLSDIEPERFAEFEQAVEAAIAAKGGA